MGFSGRPMKTTCPVSLVKDSLVVQSCNKIFGNTWIDTNMSKRDNHIRQCSEEHFIRQLKIEKPFTLIKDLWIWVHRSQKEEICADLIWDLTKMNEDEQKIYLNYLWNHGPISDHFHSGYTRKLQYQSTSRFRVNRIMH